MEEVAPQPGCVCMCVCVYGAVTSIVRVSLTTGLLTDNRRTPSRRKPRAEALSGSRTLASCIPLPTSAQVEAVQPVQKRAVCIQTAGCYGQSGNGGQGTDWGRGSRPVDSHQSHHGRLSSAERLVAHS